MGDSILTRIGARGALVAGLVVASVAASPLAAQAQTVRHRDARHDMIRISDHGSFTHARRTRLDDITWTRVDYRARRLVVTVHFRKLDRYADQMHEVDVVTPHALVSVSVSHDALDPRGSQSAIVLRYGQQRPSTCHGAGHRLAYRANLVRVSIPSRCLGYARRVHVGESTLRYSGGAIYSDDAFRRGTSRGDGMITVRRG